MFLRRRAAAALTTLALALLSLTACDGGNNNGGGGGGGTIISDPGPGDSGGDSGSEPGTDGGDTSPAGQLQALPTNGTCSVTGDMEGAFTSSSQMPDYLTCIIPGVEQWIDTVYAQMPHPLGYYYVPEGVNGTIDQCPVAPDSLEYCNTNQYVYLGQDAIWEQYSVYGDAAPVVVLAHEVTHHFQNTIGMPKPQVPNDLIKTENQADCGAGAFMAWARSQGMMAKDDINDLAGSLQAAGESESHGERRTHGTIQERLNAFDQSYTSGLQQPMEACNSFVPTTPIFSAA